MKAEAGYLFYITRTSPNVYCWTGDPAKICQYTFNEDGMQLFKEPIALKRLIEGRIYYEWGPIWPGEWIAAGIYIRYNNTWLEIWKETQWHSSPEGIINLPDYLILPNIMCMDAIQIQVAAAVSNVRMKAFECKFAFI